MTDDTLVPAQLSLSHKINRLFAVVHPRSAPERSTAAVAEQASIRLGRPIAAGYIERLRNGDFDAESASAAVESELLAAIAAGFGVAAVYLTTSGAAADSIDRELELLATMRDANVASIALRGSEIDRTVLTELIESTERLVPPTG